MVTRTVVQGFGVLFSVTALILILVALCTNYWVNIQVSSDLVRTTSQVVLAEYSRHRGLFKECFVDSMATSEIKNLDTYLLGEPCLSIDYSHNGLDSSREYSGAYLSRVGLMYSMVVMFVFSALLIIIALIVWSVNFCKEDKTSPKKKWATYVKWAGIILLLSGFFSALGMAFFHGAEHMEMTLISDNDNTVPYLPYFKSSTPNRILAHTNRYYNYSYALAWLATFFEVFGGCLLFFAGICFVNRKNKKDYFDTGTLASAKSYGHRNMAYDYVDPSMKYAIAPAATSGPQYVSEVPQITAADEYYRNGRHYDPYRQGAVRHEINPTYNYDEGWRWTPN